MKLREWAEKNGVKYLTAYRWFKSGNFPAVAYQTNSGTILVEDNSLEQNMVGNSHNEAISLFLKKTVEFSKNNSTVEDFAAYVISNFQLKINSLPDVPKYSKQKPKAEEVQKHFQQFLPKTEKPKPNVFIMGAEDYEKMDAPISTTIPPVSSDLVKQFSQVVEAPGNAISYQEIMDDQFLGYDNTTDGIADNVDFNSTPQSINYTSSNCYTVNGISPNISTPNSTCFVTGVPTASPQSVFIKASDSVGQIIMPRKRGRKSLKNKDQK